MCIGASHACTASQCDLRDPGWGDPGFPHCDLFCFGTTRPILVISVGLSVCFFNGWPARYMTHKLSYLDYFSLRCGYDVYDIPLFVSLGCGVCCCFCWWLVCLWVFFCCFAFCFLFLVCLFVFLMLSVERHHLTSESLRAHEAMVLASLA